MPRRLARLEADVLTSRGMVVLLDDAGDHDLDPRADLLSLRPNCVVLLSAGATDHHALLALEVWDAAPEPVAGWEAEGAGRVRLDSGFLEVQPTDSHVLRAGPPGWYEVRAYGAGRAEIAGRTPQPGVHELRGVERFLVQLWRVV